ncbi:MAG: aromatic acid exporter family protein [Acutalibacteraceae bacterium]
MNTKRDTLIVAWKRSIAFLLASSIAIISFTIFQFSVWGLGIYLIMIVILCQAFELTDGLSMSTVLMLHIWTARSITASSLLNEATLMAIGILMGILMNLYMPNQIKKIKTYQAIIDRHFKDFYYVFQTALYYRIGRKASNTNLMYYPLFLKNQFKRQICM